MLRVGTEEPDRLQSVGSQRNTVSLTYNTPSFQESATTLWTQATTQGHGILGAPDNFSALKSLLKIFKISFGEISTFETPCPSLA